MVFTAASALSPSTLTVASLKYRLHQLHNSYPINFPRKHVSVTCFAKFPRMEYFNQPNNLAALLNYSKEKLQIFIPNSVKQFPWKKAERVAQQELLVLAKETLKISLLGLFAFNCLSDILYSISRNRELLIPLGLFVGILMSKFLDEILHELMSENTDGRLIVVSCFFVVVKVISSFLLGGNDFLFHFANGGIIQAVWSWKEFMNLNEEKSSWDDVSTSGGVDK